LDQEKQKKATATGSSRQGLPPSLCVSMILPAVGMKAYQQFKQTMQNDSKDSICAW